jgi:DNA-binding response OmpR family regulator
MEYLDRQDRIAPHILFLDLNMPCKTGIDCLKEIRENRQFDDLSIAIYSTSSSEKDIEETFNSGANVYIKKPNDFGKLKKVIHEVVSIDWDKHSEELKKETFVFSA